ncbi:uncharacterized protein LOC119629023 [Bombyx mori]|uniref:Tudor domain-containing protein n=1 Tax=Bombyx mori TaxID=7091 RepID=A0A8R2LX91_BOMMO|nr:uncharacterized protein LOC119629023 [Bombyx mori]
MIEQQMSILRKIRFYQFLERHYYWVDVTHIESPDEFYVRPVAFRNDLRFLQAPRELIKVCELQIGRIVSYKSEVVQCFVRGQLILIQMIPSGVGHEIVCDLFAMDYGFIDKQIPIWKIFKIRKYANLPALSTKCSLANYVLKPSPAETKNDTLIMRQALGVKRAKMRVCAKYGNTILVDLNEGTPNDVSISIVQMNNPPSKYMVELDEEVNEVARRQLRYIRCHVGDVLHVIMRYVSTPYRFFVSDIRTYRAYIASRPDFSYYCQYQQPLTLDKVHPGLCVAIELPDEIYERAIVLTVDKKEKKILVNKIDFGEVIETTIDKLKPVKEQVFNHMPALAMCCSSSLAAPYAYELMKELEKKPEFMIRFTSIGCTFETPSLVDIIPIIE